MYFNENFNNMMGNWMDAQQKMFDTWKDSLHIQKEDEKKEKNNNDFLQQWMGMNNDLLKNNMRLFGDMHSEDVFGKMLSSMDTYHKLYNFWKDLGQAMGENNMDKIDDIFKEWQKNYMSTLADQFTAQLPKSMQNMVKESLEIYKTYGDTADKFMKPWIENSKNFQDAFTKAYMGDQDGFLAYTKIFRDNYEKTFGKVFQAPIMGMNREHFEKQMESMDAWMRYVNTTNEFFATMYRVGAETMENMITNYKDLLEKGNQPKTFKEFYEYWWKENEEAYKALFRTDDFSKLLSQLVDASMAFKKNFDDVLEEQLQVLPLPTKSDMNSLYKTVYHLKKEIKELKKEIKGLSKESDSENKNI